MEVKGVLDRIEDDKYAVILAEEIGEEFVLDKDKFPIKLQTGEVYVLNIINNNIVGLTRDEHSKKKVDKKISKTINYIQSKKNNSKYKRNK